MAGLMRTLHRLDARSHTPPIETSCASVFSTRGSCLTGKRASPLRNDDTRCPLPWKKRRTDHAIAPLGHCATRVDAPRTIVDGVDRRRVVIPQYGDDDDDEVWDAKLAECPGLLRCVLPPIETTVRHRANGRLFEPVIRESILDELRTHKAGATDKKVVGVCHVPELIQENPLDESMPLEIATTVHRSRFALKKSQRIYRKPRVLMFAIFPFAGSSYGSEKVEIHCSLYSYARHRGSKKVVRIPFALLDETPNPGEFVRVFFGKREAQIVSLQRARFYDSEHLQRYMHASWDNCQSGDYVIECRTPTNFGQMRAVDVGVTFTTVPFEGTVVNGYRYVPPLVRMTKVEIARREREEMDVSLGLKRLTPYDPRNRLFFEAENTSQAFQRSWYQ